MRRAARERTAPAGEVAAPGRLDLDDVGAEVGEELGRIGRADEVADLEDA